MARVSMADLLNICKNKDKPPPAIVAGTKLEGKTIREKLDKLFTTRTNTALPPILQHSVDAEHRSLAICLVVVDRVPHEAIWHRWLEYQSHAEKNYSSRLWIHAKYPDRITSPWLRDRLLPMSFAPEWNSPEVVRAMLALLSTSLSDPNTARILFATESCIPLYDRNYICRTVFDEDASWVQARHSAESGWERANCFQAVDPAVIPPQAVWKAVPGWILLTRRHAEEVAALQSAGDFDLVSAWGPPGAWTETSGGVYAPEEVFFPTMLGLLGYLRDHYTTQPSVRSPPLSSSSAGVSVSSSSIGSSAITKRREVKYQMITYARWQRHGDANPITFQSFSAVELREMRASRALFGRKLSDHSCTVETWMRLVEHEQRPYPRDLSPQRVDSRRVHNQLRSERSTRSETRSRSRSRERNIERDNAKPNSRY